MQIYLVMGKPHSGKTTFIKTYLSHMADIYIDILDIEIFYQCKSIEEAFYRMKHMLKNILLSSNDNSIIILEFPGCADYERQIFIDMIKNFQNEKSINLICCWCQTNEKIRQMRLNETNALLNIPNDRNKDYDTTDIDSKDFDAVIIYESNGLLSGQEYKDNFISLHNLDTINTNDMKGDILTIWAEGKLEKQYYNVC